MMNTYFSIAVIIFSIVLASCNPGASQDGPVTHDTLNCDHHCDLDKTTPIAFLEGLRKSRNCCDHRYMMICRSVDSSWIGEENIPLLISYLDSNDVEAVPVFNVIASFTLTDQGTSTLANEAYVLIRGYRSGSYPPYSSIPLGGDESSRFRLEDSLKMETLAWWKKHQESKK